MKNYKLLFVLLTCSVLFFSCDKIKTDVKISSLSIEMDNISVTSAAKGVSGDAINFFSATKTISLDDVQGVTDEALRFRNKIESIEVGTTTSVTVTSTDDAGTVIKEFVLNANGLSNAINIPQYDLGTAYSGNLQNFVIELLTTLFKSNSVTMNTSGKTDITSGETLKVKITITNIILTTGLF